MRVLLTLLLLAAAVAGGAFFAGSPGQVEIVWQGWQVDTSVGVLVAATALLVAAAVLLALGIARLRRIPGNFRRWRAARRRRAGEAALTRSLVALAAGNAGEARRHVARARLLGDASPTALLLTAEAAQRQGDAAAARRAYAALMERPDSEFLGLRGLIGHHLTAREDAAARRLAERAKLLRPDSRWLIETLLVLQARAGDWAAARDLLDGAAKRALPEPTARHHRAVVLHELSRAAETRGALRDAAGLAARAQKLAPELAPAAAHYARLLAELGRPRAAMKALERAWRRAPHPALARAYAEMKPGADKVARAAAVQRLMAGNPDAIESRLAVAEAALDAQLWGEARRHLDGAAAASQALPAGPPRRLCLLMARLEENERANLAAARRWIDRAIDAPPEPSYVCRNCGRHDDEWQPLCSGCGSFDTLRWERPEKAVPTVGSASRATAGVDVPPMLPSADTPADSRLAATAQSDN